jgi:hypothetical protein
MTQVRLFSPHENLGYSRQVGSFQRVLLYLVWQSDMHNQFTTIQLYTPCC